MPTEEYVQLYMMVSEEVTANKDELTVKIKKKK